MVAAAGKGQQKQQARSSGGSRGEAIDIKFKQQGLLSPSRETSSKPVPPLSNKCGGSHYCCSQHHSPTSITPHSR